MKKMILMFTVLICSQAFAQTNPQSVPSNPKNLMYPSFPADDQPEPMIENSLIFRKFDLQLFEMAQKQGRSILLIFSKFDCPGCRTQAPTLAKILKDPEYKNIEIFQIDYLKQTDLNKKFNAPGWTLLVGFKGTNEVQRAPGLKQPSHLRNFLKFLL